MRVQVGFALAWSCLLFMGCGGVTPTADYSKLKLLNVSGVVTLDGKPLPAAVVTFDADDGQFSFGQTDSNGKFTLQLDSVKDGVTPGKKTVKISTTRKILGLKTKEPGDGEAPAGEEGGGEGDAAKAGNRPKELVPARYNKKSELTVEVSSEKTHFEFSLVTK
jgi:hypothetical protein